jgi:activating signal cointegrator 1
MEAAFKCLSLRQPHAWRVVLGEKKVENRAKGTKHRGKLLIHASSSKSDYEQFLQDHKSVSSASHPSWFSFGSIIGCIDLVDVRNE